LFILFYIKLKSSLFYFFIFFSNHKNKMGRTKKYETAEQANQAQKEQIRLANQKYGRGRKAHKDKVFNEQLLIIKLLNKNVVEDKEFLVEMLKQIEEKTQAALQEAITHVESVPVEPTPDTEVEAVPLEEVKKEEEEPTTVDISSPPAVTLKKKQPYTKPSKLKGKPKARPATKQKAEVPAPAKPPKKFEVLPEEEDVARKWIEEALENGDIAEEDIKIAKKKMELH
jgi:hypothetical protein